ncbi:MAG: hypothetical protein ACJ77K_01410 [Bacteroidia bacterium]
MKNGLLFFLICCPILSFPQKPQKKELLKKEKVREIDFYSIDSTFKRLNSIEYIDNRGLVTRRVDFEKNDSIPEQIDSVGIESFEYNDSDRIVKRVLQYNDNTFTSEITYSGSRTYWSDSNLKKQETIHSSSKTTKVGNIEFHSYFAGRHRADRQIIITRKNRITIHQKGNLLRSYRHLLRGKAKGIIILDSLQRPTKTTWTSRNPAYKKKKHSHKLRKTFFKKSHNETLYFYEGNLLVKEVYVSSYGNYRTYVYEYKKEPHPIGQ